MQHEIKTFQLYHLSRSGHLRNELAIMPAKDFFEQNGMQSAFKNRFYLVFLCMSGTGSLTIDNREFELCGNRVFFINYHQICRFTDVSADGYILAFSKSFYNHVYTGNRLIRSDRILNEVPPYTDIPEAAGKDLWLSFELLQREFLRSLPPSREILCLEVKVFILQYLRSAGAAKLPVREVRHKKQLTGRFSELIDRYYREFRTTAPYAEMLCVTPNYLNAVTKEHSGFTAGQLIKNRVLLEAERLLIHTALSVTEISYELGFQDNSHFGTYFKSAKKISPQQYRKNKSRPDIF